MAQNADKRVLVPAQEIDGIWKSDPQFDDSGWMLCRGDPGGVGYEKGSGYESYITLNVADRMYGGPSPNNTCYIRIPFNVTNLNLDSLDFLQLNMRYDDGFVAYLNGVKVAEANAPSSLTWNSAALEAIESSSVVSFNITQHLNALRSGGNLLAIHGLNVNTASSDFLILAELYARETFSVPAPEFSVQRGFYENSFDVIVTAQTTNASIKYTLDGSDPRTSPTALLQTSPATIRIDPESTAGQRGKTPGVILRACAVAPGYSPSASVTHTYLFVNKVGTLSPDNVKPGPGWPNPTTAANPQAINYGMDPDVLNDPRYKDLIDDALLAIPSISIATDLKHLFAPDSGIYMNAMSDGAAWERPASIELLNPNGAEGFQINAGIRIRGGWSRHGDNPKHAFRLFFRSEYGQGKLEYPLFENEGVNKFDKVDLRTSQNYSWSYPGHQGEYNTMNRDVFSRDLQREMGQPYTRSRYYHLYINGVYWGLYQSQERSEARYAASYFGGNVEDYDVVKPDDGYVIGATDGNLDAYRQVWNFCSSGFRTNTNYFKLQGLNTDGTRNPAYKVLVDIDNLIDFMLVIFYTGNFDSPTTKFGQNKNPNNFYCIYDRTGDRGFKFFAHDAEHTLRTTAGEGPGIGLYENRVNIGSLNDSYKMTVSDFSRFHPQWLHFKLSDNAEYRIRFADHVYKHFFNQGCMTPAKATALFLSRAKEIEMAIIAESARWGDTYHHPPRTKDDDWQRAIDDIVKNYFPYRTAIVLSQLKEANLYPNIGPPVFKNNNEEILAGSLEVQPGYVLKLLNSNGTKGTIQYTVNGQDPRAIGGSVASSAKDGGDETDVTINATTMIKARVQDGTTWSALHEIILFVGNNASNLKITEIHYHPMDGVGVSDNEYEFLELKNIGPAPINLSQAHFIDGLTYTFPLGTIINPNEFIVLASNRQEFNNRYGFFPFGEYAGQLDNSGEVLTLLTAANDTIFSVRYDDHAPWPESPDGGGFSLVPKEVNPTDDLNDPSNWRASFAIHGSPGRDDLPGTSVETQTTGPPTSFALHQNYPNPFNPETKIRYTLKRSGKVRLSVYDLTGREVAVLVDGVQNAGAHDAVFSGAGLVSGIYFYKLQAADGVITKKMALVR
ncbi:MAG: CotH kinase family protein [candidate division KSB1 bacterium]|nr:CotH kinase family protein [candidate division KSB1 bacterium]MDZ7300584.1 CotH kinase family protein [candidate division KSB1 bacterium]MDZ7309721.1 CotH kinase family protein [candidate division KSB1 bacterium]